MKIRSPRAILALLTALNFVNYLDRFELAALLPRIQRDLGLSNFEGGLLATVFLGSFLLTSPIFGWLGDRVPRKNLLAFGAFAWSSATIGSGLVRGTAMLFVARTFVGIGEACFTTLAPTLIDDVAPSDRRSRWQGILTLAVPLGSALGYIVGGQVERIAGWRAAFFVGGAPGILLGALVFLMAEPARELAPRGSALQSFRIFAKLKLYRRAIFGYTASTFAVGAFAYWAPAFFVKRFSLSLAGASSKFGALTVAAGVIATVIGASLADRRQKAIDAEAQGDATVRQDASYRENAMSLGERSPDEIERRKMHSLLRLCAWGSILAAPSAFFAFFAPTASLAFAAGFLCEVGVFLAYAPVNVVILRAVPTALRANAMALAILSIHLFGDLWSPALIGKLADALPASALPFAMLPLPAAFVVSAVTWWGIGHARLAERK